MRQADIPEMRVQDAYLNSYRAYTGPQDGAMGVPLGSLSRPTRGYAPPPPSSTMTSESSFLQFRPSSFRILTIVSAFLCFCPVGIAALVYSCRAQWAKKHGNFGKAALLGKSARDLAVASIVLGTSMALVILLIGILLFVPGVTQSG
ncbi:uncharacterized protein LOC106012477 [Aplysia californica]|uniref:Uncharacterized protein LOC106012477 n=1 Tax=Aplysia californica TaxID=6500 RepID=A0ABM1VX94_APLCA|nr:uncharacterized protein LOC106012477 [Aplysia californica]